MLGFLCHGRRAASLFLLARSNNGVLNRHFLQTPSSPIPFRFSSAAAAAAAAASDKVAGPSAASSSNQARSEPQASTEPVIRLLMSHGFSKMQITRMLKKFAGLLSSNPEKTLMPKLEYLYSIGIPRSDAAVILSRCPWIFARSLENHIAPTFEYLRDLLGSGDKAVQAVRYWPYVLFISCRTHFAPNVRVLIDNGVPQSSIALLAQYHSRALLARPASFKEVVDRVKGLGFDPVDYKFREAVRVMRQMSKSTWERKVRVFQQWGWSEETTIKAFQKSPSCLAVSEDKISKTMGYFINEMGAEPLFIAEHSYLFLWSLERRIVPRCSVAKILSSKCLMAKKFSIISFLTMSEKSFWKRFVTPYLDEAPELLEIYPENEDRLST